MRKELRKEFQAETNYYNKKQIIERIKMKKEHIIDKQKEGRGNKIRKIADSIKRNVNNGSKIWDVKRRVTKKDTVKKKIKYSKGKILQDSEAIIKEYEEYYKQLLTTRKPENTAETIAEERLKEEFERIMKQKTDSRQEKITFSMIKKAISIMKKRKARDKVGWKADWLIEGGDEMIKSLEILYNRIEQERIVPKQWQQVIIISVDKKGNGEELSKSQRDLFLVNIVSKVYKKIKKAQNEIIHNKMSEMQTAGKKQRSTMENIVIVSAITEQRRIEKRNTYIFFADAVKCFDKLWLQDCIIELAKLGYSKNDLEILYKSNETAQVKINTSYGDTENIEIKEVV